jgi:SNF2 family DNA or RNA helicase
MKLLNYQAEKLNEVKDLNRVAFYWDMGTGKTFVGAEKLYQLNTRVNLVICQKSKINDWYDHFMENYNDKYIIFDLTNKVMFESFLHDALVDQYIEIIGIINYELAFRRSELLDLNDYTLMLDESSMIQNETAKRSKFVLKLGENASNVILLSGTPTGGKYENLWSQLHLLGWNISKRMYWNQYIEVEYLDNLGFSIPIVIGYKNVDRLKRKMKKYGCQFLKTDEVMELPDQVFDVNYVDTTKQYQRFRKTGIVKIYGKELVGNTTLSKLLHERELCSFYNANKSQKVKDLINSTDENIVIFYNFNAELKELKKILRECDKDYSVINGNDKSGLDMLNYSLNHNYRYIPILLIQYQSGAMGLNLQDFSRRIIFYSLPLSSELFEQAKKRIHRIGQKSSCFYYILLCKNSVEEKIYQTLLKRKDYTEKLFERGE